MGYQLNPQEPKYQRGNGSVPKKDYQDLSLTRGPTSGPTNLGAYECLLMPDIADVRDCLR